jgi:hypothetical protein
MKHILFASAGHEFPKGPFAFLTGMQQQQRLHVKALFFRPTNYAALASALPGGSLIPVLELEDNEKELMETHKAIFARQCKQVHFDYTLHDNNEGWNKDLIARESRFADLLVISAQFFYAESDGNQPNHYLREALHAAECPVLIVPEDYTSVQHLFMAYDGSRESLYAIKQFCYLFPDLLDLPAEMLYIKEEPDGIIPDLENLKQFTRLKFDCVGFSKLPFKADD